MVFPLYVAVMLYVKTLVSDLCHCNYGVLPLAIFLIMRNFNKLRNSKKLPAKRDEFSFGGTQDVIPKGDRTSKVP